MNALAAIVDDLAPISEATGAKLTRDDFAAIKSAVASVGSEMTSLPPDARFDMKHDLGQELAIKLLRGKLTIEALRVAARNWVRTALRDRARARVIETAYENGTARRYKTGALWSPTWYPPHPDAEQFAPFACKEARVMSVKGAAGSFHNVEEALAEVLDARGVWSRK